MKDFLLIFRGDHKAMPQLSPEEMQALTQTWMNWVAGIAAQGNLADRGNRLMPTGKVVSGNNVISDGPYAEIKESIMGYTMVKAASLEEAVELTSGCPALQGGNVEVREINPL
jgi:hypothetical protein